MKINQLDESLRDTFHVADIVSEKVEGGYKLKVYIGKAEGGHALWDYLDYECLDGDDELNFRYGRYVIDKKK